MGARLLRRLVLSRAPQARRSRLSLTEADGCATRSPCFLWLGKIWERSFLEVDACCLYAKCISYTEGEDSACFPRNFLPPFSASATVVIFPTKPPLNSAISAPDTSETSLQWAQQDAQRTAGFLCCRRRTLFPFSPAGYSLPPASLLQSFLRDFPGLPSLSLQSGARIPIFL